LEARDKFNISPWDYARNKQLHYCQLIIMSHQRQRLKSNPASPLPNGLGLSLTSLNGYLNGDDYDHMIVSKNRTFLYFKQLLNNTVVPFL
jgi:hypothetical protein